MNLKDLKNRTLLLFGKSRAFNDSEFNSQMKYHNIDITKELTSDISIVIEGRMMTPYEQNSSEALYKEGVVSFISIDELEGELAKSIDEDTLLMSLKLSHDKERLKSFLLNSKVSDKLFFRLLKMYSFSKEDFFENDDNRDVSAAFISRFYENIERNHNIEFSTSGFIQLVAQTQSCELLKEISLLEPLKFHPKINMAIAMSPYCDESMQKRFFKSADESILEALSLNKRLKRDLVVKFLEDENLALNIARNLILDDDLFELLKKYKIGLALNETLTLAMQKELLSLEIQEINYALALNNSLKEEIVEKLLKLENPEIQEAIYENASTPLHVLKTAYENEQNYLALAKNESTPIEILYQLQLDARYERYVKSNAGFGKHIQTQNIGWL
jgi:hypothetical protein